MTMTICAKNGADQIDPALCRGCPDLDGKTLCSGNFDLLPIIEAKGKLPATGADRITAVREIVTNKQYAKIDGTLVDLFSASYIVAVYDALSPENQAKYANMSVRRMADIAFKVAK